MKTLIIYILISIIYTVINLLDEYFKLNKKIKAEPVFKNFIITATDFIKHIFNYKTPLGKKLTLMLLNPYSLFVFAVYFIMLCPLFFPYSILMILDNIIFYKKHKAREYAYKKNKDWLKNEGEENVINDDTHSDSFEDIIKPVNNN
ncbi:MAG: hypothetical protein AABY22_11715 [Nanoarchaeota archaeon]